MDEKDISCRDVFAIWEKEFPPAAEPPKQEETLFKIEEEQQPVEPEQAPVIPPAAPSIELPKDFEENLVNKITSAILEKLSAQGGEQNG